MNVGARVRLKRVVERYPHARVDAGETGTVTHDAGDLVEVTLDEQHAGLLAWGNALQWFGELLDDLEDDLEPLEASS